MFLSPGAVCSLQDEPVIGRRDVDARSSKFILKSGIQDDCALASWSTLYGSLEARSFIEQGGRGPEGVK